MTKTIDKILLMTQIARDLAEVEGESPDLRSLSTTAEVFEVEMGVVRVVLGVGDAESDH